MQLFYILSGFLITGILLDTASAEDYYRTFYVRRALRILPAYLLMLLVLKVDHIISWRFVLAALLYIANMASLVGARTSEYGALWSLAVEEQFYLIWPFIIRRFSLHALTRIILGYFVFGLVLRAACHFFWPHADTSYKLWFNAEMLLSGALISICLRRDLLRADNICRIIYTLWVVALVGWPAVIFIDVHPFYQRIPELRETLYRLTLICTYASFLLLVLKRNQGTGPQYLVMRAMVFFGYISYGLYLVHQFVFLQLDRLAVGTWLGAYQTNSWSLLANTGVALATATLIAYISRRFFEDLFLQKKGKVAAYKGQSTNQAPVEEAA